MSLFKGDSNLIGLDLGTTGVRVVQVRPGGTPRLVTYGALSVDSKVMQSESEADKQQLLAAIKKLLDDSRVTSRNVVAGLPSSKVFSSLISLPTMSDAELEKAISYQAEQYIPMALDQVKLDWINLGSSSDANQVDVLLIAAPITLTERYLNVLEQAGLEVVALEPDALALGRSLVATPDAAVVLDVGAASTDLLVVYQGQTRLIRSIPVGGENFVKAAAQTLNLGTEQAMQFVFKFGLAEGKLEGQVKKALSSQVDSLVSEVDKSNKFFLGHYKEVKLAKLVLTGQASLVPDLPATIANSINIPVEIGNPWGRIEMPADMQQKAVGVASHFGVAAGLALRGVL